MDDWSSSPGLRPHAVGPQAAAPVPRDSLGCTRDELVLDRELSGTPLRCFRKVKRSPHAMRVATTASSRGFLLGISLQAGHRRHVMRGHHGSWHDFDAGSIYIRDFAEDYRADLAGAFDIVMVELPFTAFEQACEERAGPRVRTLACVTGTPDPVLLHLGHALAAAMERPEHACTLFVDQLGGAISTHLVDRYGGLAGMPAPVRRRLSRGQEARAKEMLRSRLDGSLTVAEVAQACQLSRSYFMRAFRDSTGMTPMQWLQAERLSMARSLLLDTAMKVSEVATACGFADQSHFTRAFARAEGQPPATWRRQARSG